MILYLQIMIQATVVPLLLAVAFLTLVERRVMGAMQRRQGPNAWGLFGVLQPFLDGLKLLLKEPILPSSADQPLFQWAPILTFLTSQIAWAALPTSTAGAVRDQNLGTMYVLAVGSLGVYGILLRGWRSNSKYAFQGCCRSVAQMISYEQPMGLIVLCACMIANSLNWSALVESQQNGIFLLPLWPLALIWIICCLAEQNRAPFDLPEAEAELVAGYNVEYRSMGFALFFIREYRSMIMMATVTRLLFLGGTAAPMNLFFQNWLPGSFWLRLKATSVVFIYIWVRATLPRYKYSDLMDLGWKRLQPLTLAGVVANAVVVFNIQMLSNLFVFDLVALPARFASSAGGLWFYRTKVHQCFLRSKKPKSASPYIFLYFIYIFFISIKVQTKNPYFIFYILYFILFMI